MHNRQEPSCRHAERQYEKFFEHREIEEISPVYPYSRKNANIRAIAFFSCFSILTPMNTAIHIGFFGTPHLAADVLDDLLADNRFAVDFVVTNPDKPFGRHGELRQSDVKVVAQGAHIEVLQPEKIR